MPSRAHLFFSAKKAITDGAFKAFFAQPCRRQSLLEGIGGVLNRGKQDFACCDKCDAVYGTMNARLNIEASTTVVRRRPKRVRRAVSPDLEAKLMAARDKTLDEHPCFKMVGGDFVCTKATIRKLCEEAELSAVEVRAELKDNFSAILGFQC